MFIFPNIFLLLLYSTNSWKYKKTNKYKLIQDTLAQKKEQLHFDAIVCNSLSNTKIAFSTFFIQGSSASFGEQYATASATVRKILSSPRKFAKLDVWSLSMTNGPGFARTSCQKIGNFFS
jgi:hypothetical protein